MTLVDQILPQMLRLTKPHRAFLRSMFLAFFVFRGHATRTNLHRYGAPDPRTQYRWQHLPFDWIAWNRTCLKTAGVLDRPLAAVIDASFVSKSRTHTYGVAHFYNGCVGKAMRGLEISTIGLVDLQEETAYAYHTRQTSASLPEGTSRLDFYTAHLTEVAPQWPKSVRYVLHDGAYSTHSFVDTCRGLHLHTVGKLRRDAALRYLYDGPRKKGPGRPKKYDGKVHFDALQRWERLASDKPDETLYTVVAWHNTLKRKIRVVLVEKWQGQKRGYVLLYSTDLDLDAPTIVHWYRLRFQVEFVFRDAKQYAGLCDGQMRDQQSLDFHFNLSMAVVNVLRLSERQRGAKVLSLASAKRRNLNSYLIDRIFSILGQEPEKPEIRAQIEQLRDHGVIRWGQDPGESEGNEAEQGRSSPLQAAG